ncbi:MAG: hypothetical protein JWP36_688 [Paucimonas sp.]|nr:hypothetical protein [Paucimonas sp.]
MDTNATNHSPRGVAPSPNTGPARQPLVANTAESAAAATSGAQQEVPSPGNFHPRLREPKRFERRVPMMPNSGLSTTATNAASGTVHGLVTSRSSPALMMHSTAHHPSVSGLAGTSSSVRIPSTVGGADSDDSSPRESGGDPAILQAVESPVTTLAALLAQTILDSARATEQARAAGAGPQDNDLPKALAPQPQEQSLTMAIAAGAPRAHIVKLCEAASAQDAAMLDRCDSAGRTPLCIAVEIHDLALVDLLLKAGARPDAVDAGGRSPAMLAVLAKDSGALARLLRQGARLDPGALVSACMKLLDADAVLFLADAVPHLATGISRALVLHLTRLACRADKAFRPIFRRLVHLCADEDLLALAAGVIGAKPRRLTTVLNAIPADVLHKNLRSLRQHAAVCSAPLAYDLLAERDPALAGLLAAKKLNPASASLVDDELRRAMLAGSATWIGKLVHKGALPQPDWIDAHPAALLAALAEHNLAALSSCLAAHQPDDDVLRQALLATWSATGFKRLLQLCNRGWRDLVTPERAGEFMDHAISLRSDELVQALVQARPEYLRTLLTDPALGEYRSVKSRLDRAIDSGSRELVRLLLVLGVKPTWDQVNRAWDIAAEMGQYLQAVYQTLPEQDRY